jgi:hypothetical protein
MNIEVLHIDECPNWESVGKVLNALIAELELGNLAPNFTLIRTPQDAAKHRFAGSPTILIDGIDLVPNAEQTAELACRVYHDGNRMVGAPTKTMLKAGLLRGLDKPTI